jgi:hypothetical protein
MVLGLLQYSNLSAGSALGEQPVTLCHLFIFPFRAAIPGFMNFVNDFRFQLRAFLPAAVWHLGSPFVVVVVASFEGIEGTLVLACEKA